MRVQIKLCFIRATTEIYSINLFYTSDTHLHASVASKPVRAYNVSKIVTPRNCNNLKIISGIFVFNMVDYWWRQFKQVLLPIDPPPHAHAFEQAVRIQSPGQTTISTQNFMHSGSVK